MSDPDSETATARRPSPSPIPALRGAITFLTRIPIPGGTRADWDAFRRSPWTLPVVGAIVGTLAGIGFSLPVPWPTAVTAYLAVVYLVSGVTHADGLADLGDAIAAHDPETRREVLKDSETGVGGALALGLTLIALALGATGVATTLAAGSLAVRMVIAAEVGAKLGMALLVCFGEPAHEGLGSQLVGVVGRLSFVPAVVVASAVLVAPPFGAVVPLVAALLGGPAVAVALLVGTRSWLGGVSGDVLGAANELGRAVALHAGVIAWAIL
ncbi:adenosylcobinamide-GDP ribazoletransferase [Haloparvum sp. PAK95]|uniref:adenosylcobinamide-GDP ribazoletransferase n=1 Tax=Haloparvum sp. PAK95 TaxID=3418962 RepID=UPI003D2F31F8